MKLVNPQLFVKLILVVSLLITSCTGQSGLQKEKNIQPEMPATSETVKPNRTSIGKKLKENEHLPIEERVALYYQLKKENYDAYTFEYEDDHTMYGYSLLWRGKTREALEIFKLIVAEFPDSSNPYDSLGEVYLELGDKKKALENYEKSLELNPENYNAVEQIKRIKNIHTPIEDLAWTPDEKTGDKFSRTYKVAAYRDDLDQLGKTLEEIHPNVFRFMSKTEFWKLVEEKKSRITPNTTYGEFAWHCNEIIAAANCSHTSAGGFFPEWEMLPAALRFPLRVYLVEGQLFVIDNSGNEEKVAVRDEIVTINGTPVSSLIRDIYNHIPSQGLIETSKRHDFNFWARGMIAYALNFPEKFEITLKGKKQSVVLNTDSPRQNNYEPPFKNPCPDNLCLEILEDPKAAILSIASFNYYWWNNLDEFEAFMDKSFKEIAARGIEELIIDVRFNGGGSNHSSIYLLRYLSDRPFTYYSEVMYDEETGIQMPFENAYKGKCYFLIDGNGNSTTGHFMSIVKDLNLGTIIGEELGSNQLCTAGQKICRLSNTGLEYYVANVTVVSSATSLPDEKGILPDHYVSQSIDNYLNNKDVVKTFALELIKK